MNKDVNDYFIPTYNRSTPAIVKGKGTYLYDSNGKKYLDFSSGIGVTVLGHSHPEIVAAIKKQGSKLLHASNLYMIEPQIKLAELLVKHSFGDRVFFCNSGTEANEAAIKFSRKYAAQKNPEKYHILSFTDGFHGRTYGGLSATAQDSFHEGFKPILSGFHYAPFNDIEKTKNILDKNQFAAIFIEPLQGESGFNIVQSDFLKFLYSYSRKHDIILVFDEVQCGYGRTGSLWYYEQTGVEPDMMTLAKPMGGGLPLGGVICREKIALAIKPGDHGSTFGGNPLACEIGRIILQKVSKKGFLKSVKKLGEYLREKLDSVISSNPECRCLQGTGLMTGVRMKNDPSLLIKSCKENGLLLIKAKHNTVRFMPPLTVSEKEIDRAVNIFEKTLNKH